MVPALRGNYVGCEHKVIIPCKKVFQIGLNFVQIGNSPTNCFLHQFFLHAVKLVIGPNTWIRELENLEHDDREWINQNSVQ